MDLIQRKKLAGIHCSISDYQFDIKNVCTPNINIPTNPLNIPTYLAPLKPIDNLRITGKDSPVLCEVLPIMFVRIKINNVAIKHPDKTIIEFKSYNK